MALKKEKDLQLIDKVYIKLNLFCFHPSPADFSHLIYDGFLLAIGFYVPDLTVVFESDLLFRKHTMLVVKILPLLFRNLEKL